MLGYKKDGLVQKRCNSSAYALELHLFYINPLTAINRCFLPIYLCTFKTSVLFHKCFSGPSWHMHAVTIQCIACDVGYVGVPPSDCSRSLPLPAHNDTLPRTHLTFPPQPGGKNIPRNAGTGLEQFWSSIGISIWSDLWGNGLKWLNCCSWSEDHLINEVF